MRRKFLIIAMMAMLLTAACSGSNDEPSSGATEPPVASPTQTVEEPTATPEVTSEPTTPEETTEPTDTPATQPPPAKTAPPVASDPCTRSWPSGTGPQVAQLQAAPVDLVGARVGRHGTCDRVAFDFSGLSGVSFGYHVEYVPVVTQDGSGDPVPVKGNAFLHVIIDGAMPDGDLADAINYARDWPALREVKYAGWFEGHHTIAIGVKERVPFKVVRYGDVVYIDLKYP
jgi:hypothetical protein